MRCARGAGLTRRLPVRARLGLLVVSSLVAGIAGFEMFETSEPILGALALGALVVSLWLAWFIGRGTDAVHAQLADSELKYRRIYESLQDVYVETALDGTILDVSPQIEVLTRGQYKRDEFPGWSATEFYADAGRRADFTLALMERGRVSDFEMSFLNRDGSEIPCSVSATVLRDADGRAKSIVSTLRDVTERRREERVERDSRHRLQSILDSIFARVGLFTLEGVVIEANRALVEVAGQKREDVIGKPLWDAYWWSHSPVTQQQVREALRRAAQGETVRDDFRVRLAENVFIIIDATFGPVRDEKGRVTQLVGSSVDITDRKSVEEKLRKRDAQLGLLTENIPAAVAYVDRDQVIQAANYRYVELHCGAGVEVIGRHLRDVVGETAWPEVAKRNAKVFAGEPAVYEHTHERRDGERREIEVHLEPDRSAGGEVRGYYAFVLDITERKCAEDRIRAALVEKEVLLQEIYHRVKNNLQVVSSLLNMQGRMAADGRTRDLLRESADRVKSMALVHEQLYRSQDLSNISLTEYLEKLTEHLMAAHRPLSSRVAVKLEAEALTLGIETAVPLGLIVNELVSNAYKHGYGPEAARGQISLKVRRLEGGRVQLAVSDDGHGLPAGFEPKEVASLGLQLVLTLTQQLGGELRCATAAGCTSFEVVFRPQHEVPERKVA